MTANDIDVLVEDNKVVLQKVNIWIKVNQLK